MEAAPFRLALVGPLPPPFGGMANQTKQLAELLRAEGVDVDVVRVNTPYRPAWVGRLPGLRALFRLAPYLYQLWVAAGRCDVFHVMANSGWSWHLFAAPAIWIAKARGKPVVLNYRGGEAEEFFARAFTWVKPSLRKVDVVIVPSGFLGGVFGKRNIDTRIVPNIVNLELFAPSGRTGEPIHILVARNLERLYDNASALRAFALVLKAHPTARMTVAGSGPEREALGLLARNLGVDHAVTFAGRVANNEMALLYRTASIALNPSLADNMPISILESLASGVPVVSTNVGGIPFLVKDGATALLVRPGDPEAMAAACLRLLADCELAERLSEAGKALSRDFAWEQIRGKLFAVYTEALGRRALTEVR